jgi:hypothetical protein
MVNGRGLVSAATEAANRSARDNRYPFLVVAVLPPLLAGGEDSENEVRGTLLQALGGLVLLAGLYLTYRTFDLNRQGQVTERFSRAIDQLGEESKLDV